MFEAFFFDMHLKSKVKSERNRKKLYSNYWGSIRGNRYLSLCPSPGRHDFGTHTKRTSYSLLSARKKHHLSSTSHRYIGDALLINIISSKCSSWPKVTNRVLGDTRRTPALIANLSHWIKAWECFSSQIETLWVHVTDCAIHIRRRHVQVFTGGGGGLTCPGTHPIHILGEVKKHTSWYTSHIENCTDSYTTQLTQKRFKTFEKCFMANVTKHFKKCFIQVILFGSTYIIKSFSKKIFS